MLMYCLLVAVVELATTVVEVDPAAESRTKLVLLSPELSTSRWELEVQLEQAIATTEEMVWLRRLEASQLTEETVAVHGVAAVQAALQFLDQAQVETAVEACRKLVVLALMDL
jgi:hypothetical protein